MKMMTTLGENVHRIISINAYIHYILSLNQSVD